MDSETFRCATGKVWSQRLYVGSPSTWMPPMSTSRDVLLDEYFTSTGSRRQSKPIYHLPFFLLDRNFTGDVHFLDGGFYGRPKSKGLPSDGYYASGFVPLSRYHQDLRVYHMSAPANHSAFSKDKENAQLQSAEGKQATSGEGGSRSSALDTPRRQPFILHAPTAEETALEAFRAIFGANELESFTPRHDARDAAAGRVALPPTPPPPVFIPPSSASSDSSPSLESSSPASSLEPPTDDLRAPTPFRIIPALPLRFPGLFASPEYESEGVFDGEGQGDNRDDLNQVESVTDTESEWEWDEEEATMAIFFGSGVNDEEDDEDGLYGYEDDEDDSGLPPMRNACYSHGVESGDIGLMPMTMGGNGRRERVRFVLPDERDYAGGEGWYADEEEGDWEGYDDELEYASEGEAFETGQDNLPLQGRVRPRCP